MKEATLGQIQKILSLLEGVPYDEVQKALGSSEFVALLRGEKTNSKKTNRQLEDELENKIRRRIYKESWRLVKTLTKLEDIYITIPHVAINDGRFELGCWRGEHGHVSIDHIDGNDLFRIMIPRRLTACNDPDCLWVNNLEEIGLYINSYHIWKREIRTSNGFKYDVLIPVKQ